MFGITASGGWPSCAIPSSVASEPYGLRVDPLELFLEVEGRELRAAGAERVRLDQLGARVDEAHVQRDDSLGRADVRLLGTAQPLHRARHECAHAAVADDH